jgi:hypothetical protein
MQVQLFLIPFLSIIVIRAGLEEHHENCSVPKTYQFESLNWRSRPTQRLPRDSQTAVPLFLMPQLRKRVPQSP